MPYFRLEFWEQNTIYPAVSLLNSIMFPEFSKARGYRNPDNMTCIAYLIADKLDFTKLFALPTKCGEEPHKLHLRCVKWFFGSLYNGCEHTGGVVLPTVAALSWTFLSVTFEFSASIWISGRWLRRLLKIALYWLDKTWCLVNLFHYLFFRHVWSYFVVWWLP